MPHNRYTKETHAEQRKLTEIQQVQMERLSNALAEEGSGAETPLLPVVNPKKTERGVRRAESRKHKPAKHRNSGTQSF